MSDNTASNGNSQAEPIIVSEPVGLDKVGEDDATNPEDEIAIELPIEENDFNSNTV